MAGTRTRAFVSELPPGEGAEPEAAPPTEPGSLGKAATTASLAAVAPRAERLASRHGAGVVAPLVTFFVFLGLAIAPMAAAIAALWAIGTALITLANIVLLAQAGQALVSPDSPLLLETLDTAVRVGFLAIGYLALIFALIALMAGLLGRGWGRLFILPGAVFTATALALLGIGVVFTAPLTSALPIPQAWFIPLALYALVDAVLVSGAMVDARLTRSPSATGKRRAVRHPPREAEATPV